MNGEEKKAIDYITAESKFHYNAFQLNIDKYDLDILLNLIKKQQDKIASKNKEIKLLKDIHNKHVTIIKKQKKETEEKINKAQYVINEYETYIKYLEEKVSD